MQIFKSLSDPELVQMIRSGKVGVLPTDTVYGLVAAAGNRDAVTRLYALKARENKPGTIIAANSQQLIELGLKARYVKAVEAYWPNPLSVVLPCGEELAYLHQDKKSLAVRVPSSDTVHELLLGTGALLTSSANQPGEPVACNLAEAQGYFGETVDFYVDGGEVTDHQPSTVVRIVDDAIEVLRKGAVDIDENGRIRI